MKTFNKLLVICLIALTTLSCVSKSAQAAQQQLVQIDIDNGKYYAIDSIFGITYDIIRDNTGNPVDYKYYLVKNKIVFKDIYTYHSNNPNKLLVIDRLMGHYLWKYPEPFKFSKDD